MVLSAGGGGEGKGLSTREDMRVKKGKRDTDIISIVSFVYLLINENLNLKLYLIDSKIGINAFIQEGLCKGRLI